MAPSLLYEPLLGGGIVGKPVRQLGEGDTLPMVSARPLGHGAPPNPFILGIIVPRGRIVNRAKSGEPTYAPLHFCTLRCPYAGTSQGNRPMSAKVVVFVTAELRIDEITQPGTSYVVGCLRELGLYAHGKDCDEALTNLKSHFRHFIEALRSTGELETRLDEAKVRWLPDDEARKQNIDYEDLRPDRPLIKSKNSERAPALDLARSELVELAAAA